MRGGNAAYNGVAENRGVGAQLVRLAAYGLYNGDVAPHGRKAAREVSARGAAENRYLLRVNAELVGARAYLVERVRRVHKRSGELCVAGVGDDERRIARSEVLQRYRLALAVGAVFVAAAREDDDSGAFFAVFKPCGLVGEICLYAGGLVSVDE